MYRCSKTSRTDKNGKVTNKETGKETQMSDGKYDELNNQFDISILT